MNRLIIVSLTLGMVLALAGCKPAAPPPQIFKTQIDALEKAKGVEQQLQQARDKAREAEEEQQK
ncbi:hypothetical protein [Collimonas sp.]|jgi:hypothetical protein|uniref:hypothetical protein n=1 Tax=Collimonas sp. TaxID=1963772 RepID=UPI002C5D7649|nr:hypothetical protein [Collimonas sp.]HWW08341.1 hypothetical protein [Collimonas sp.]